MQETAVRGWRRSLEHLSDAAKLKQNGKKLRAPTHMLRHTFAIEKLNAGASWEDVSLLLAHHRDNACVRKYPKGYIFWYWTNSIRNKEGTELICCTQYDHRYTEGRGRAPIGSQKYNT